MTDAHLGPRRLWPDPAAGPWCIHLDWAVIDGRWECVDFRMHSQPVHDRWEARLGGLAPDQARPEPVTRTVLRAVDLGRLVDQVREREMLAIEAEQADRFRPADPSVLEHEHAAWARWRPGVPGRPLKHDRAFYERVVAVYRRALVDGRAPTKAVADRHGVPRGTAAKWIWHARNVEHLLDPTEPGKKRGRSPR